METALDNQISNIESTHPGYDEYRYDLAEIGHNPYELASYLTVLFEDYTRAEVQSTLERFMLETGGASDASDRIQENIDTLMMMLLLMMSMGSSDTAEPPSAALTPDGNLTLVDDYDEAHADGSGKQFITLVTKAGKFRCSSGFR